MLAKLNDETARRGDTQATYENHEEAPTTEEGVVCFLQVSEVWRLWGGLGTSKLNAKVPRAS